MCVLDPYKCLYLPSEWLLMILLTFYQRNAKNLERLERFTKIRTLHSTCIQGQLVSCQTPCRKEEIHFVNTDGDSRF